MNKATNIGPSYTSRLTKQELREPAFAQEYCDALQKEWNTLSRADRKIAMQGSKFVLLIHEIVDGKARVRLVPAWNAECSRTKPTC
jgi:hypothetical protein